MVDPTTPSQYELNPFDAHLAAEILLRLADLIDGGDGTSPQEFLLSETQLSLLSKPATIYSVDQWQTAQRLREVSARIEGQLPPHGPALEH